MIICHWLGLDCIDCYHYYQIKAHATQTNPDPSFSWLMHPNTSSPFNKTIDALQVQWLSVAFINIQSITSKKILAVHNSSKIVHFSQYYIPVIKVCSELTNFAELETCLYPDPTLLLRGTLSSVSVSSLLTQSTH